MEHGTITAQTERKITDNRGNTKLTERSIRPRIIVTSQPKDALREKQDSKWHRTLLIKFIIIVWKTTRKYGKLIHRITLLVVCIFLKCW